MNGQHSNQRHQTRLGQAGQKFEEHQDFSTQMRPDDEEQHNNSQKQTWYKHHRINRRTSPKMLGFPCGLPLNQGEQRTHAHRNISRSVPFRNRSTSIEPGLRLWRNRSPPARSRPVGFRGIGVLFGCFRRRIDGDSWFTWWFFLIHQGNASISPKGTPIPTTCRKCRIAFGGIPRPGKPVYFQPKRTPMFQGHSF